ncbi:unnamed protein product [Symbiodinium sp. CCMP2592]|nr:unnamed protein product [Symbiodinium sp. CCMP2592]
MEEGFPRSLANDLEVAVEVDAHGGWQVVYPKGICQLPEACASFRIRLREIPAVAFTVEKVGGPQEWKVSDMEQEFLAAARTWLEEERRAIEKEEEQGRRRRQLQQKKFDWLFLRQTPVIMARVYRVERLAWYLPLLVPFYGGMVAINYSVVPYSTVEESDWTLSLVVMVGMGVCFFCIPWVVPQIIRSDRCLVATSVFSGLLVFLVAMPLELLRLVYPVALAPFVGLLIQGMSTDMPAELEAQTAEISSRTKEQTIVFEGTVSPERGKACVVSWPGKYATAWDHLVESARGGQTSAAVVFLPEGTPHYGQHVRIPGSERLEGECWCTPLYGEKRDWGCLWWALWMENVERAVRYGAELHVYFFEGARGKGKVASFVSAGAEYLKREALWEEFQNSETLKDAKAAGLENLCDKKRYDSSSQYSREEHRLFLEWLSFEDRKLLEEGLGNSQKAEVAWLESKGYRYTEVDIASWLRPAARSHFTSGPLPAMVSPSQRAPKPTFSVDTTSMQDVLENLSTLKTSLSHPNLASPDLKWDTEMRLKQLLVKAHPQCPGLRSAGSAGNWKISRVSGKCTEERLANAKPTVNAPKSIAQVSQLKLPDLISENATNGMLLVVICLAAYAKEQSNYARLLVEKAHAALWQKFCSTGSSALPVKLVAVELTEAGSFGDQYGVKEVPYCLMYMGGKQVYGKRLHGTRMAPRAAAAAKPKVLLVEPNPGNQLKLERNLRRNGYGSDLAMDGMQASRLAQRPEGYGILLISSLTPADQLRSVSHAIRSRQRAAVILAFDSTLLSEEEAEERKQFLQECSYVFPYGPSYTGLAAVLARFDVTHAEKGLACVPCTTHKQDFLDDVLGMLEKGGGGRAVGDTATS